MCKDLTQKTTDFQKAVLKSQLQRRYSTDSSAVSQKVQRGEPAIFILILYKDLLVNVIRVSTLY